jgi:pimeloyl-ACP methyl ester carboxylesterase
LIDRVPAELRPALRSFWSRPKSYEALASQIANVPESARIVAEAGTPFGAIPVTALTAANPTPKRLREREALLASSRDGRHVIAERSGHFIPLEEPQLVVDAVLDVVCRVRRELAVSRT